jgi:DNA gyrase subunit A
LAYEFSQSQVEQIGIRIRSAARLVDGRYSFSEQQADQILDLRLYQLTGLEREKITNEYGELLTRIDDLLDILNRADRVMSIIKEELVKVKDKYDSARVTEIVPADGDINIEDLIANEGCIITITHAGYIKRTAESEFRAQRRGGRGVLGMATREAQMEGEEGDFVEHLFTASTHDSLMFFTQTGRCYVEKVYEIPEMSRSSKGRSIANLLELRPEEKIAATLRIEAKKEEGSSEETTWNPSLHIMFATRHGLVKKTNLSEFANVRRGGIIAIQIEQDDELIDALLTNGSEEVVLITKEGMSIRFHEDDARDMGRNAIGVWGIRPDAGDEVVGIAKVVADAKLLVAGANGIGKRTGFEEYRLQSRGGKGIITMKTGDRTGGVIGALSVHEADEVMLITTGGQMVRLRVGEIRETGRNTMGVKLINLIEGEKLQDIAPVVSQEDLETETEEAQGPMS